MSGASSAESQPTDNVKTALQVVVSSIQIVTLQLPSPGDELRDGLALKDRTGEGSVAIRVRSLVEQPGEFGYPVRTELLERQLTQQ